MRPSTFAHLVSKSKEHQQHLESNLKVFAATGAVIYLEEAYEQSVKYETNAQLMQKEFDTPTSQKLVADRTDIRLTIETLLRHTKVAQQAA
ncbi:MAG: hypothetical protein EON60_13255 [Alphaproteobacteria bacterium]|nr:MAG: hypothetical protein EON60_13255 [Alphaproteobacteria bacterium]